MFFVQDPEVDVSYCGSFLPSVNTLVLGERVSRVYWASIVVVSLHRVSRLAPVLGGAATADPVLSTCVFCRTA